MKISKHCWFVILLFSIFLFLLFYVTPVFYKNDLLYFYLFKFLLFLNFFIKHFYVIISHTIYFFQNIILLFKFIKNFLNHFNGSRCVNECEGSDDEEDYQDFNNSRQEASNSETRDPIWAQLNINFFASVSAGSITALNCRYWGNSRMVGVTTTLAAMATSTAITFNNSAIGNPNNNNSILQQRIDSQQYRLDEFLETQRETQLLMRSLNENLRNSELGATEWRRRESDLSSRLAERELQFQALQESYEEVIEELNNKRRNSGL